MMSGVWQVWSFVHTVRMSCRHRNHLRSNSEVYQARTTLCVCLPVVMIRRDIHILHCSHHEEDDRRGCTQRNTSKVHIPPFFGWRWRDLGAVSQIDVPRGMHWGVDSQNTHLWSVDGERFEKYVACVCWDINCIYGRTHTGCVLTGSLKVSGLLDGHSYKAVSLPVRLQHNGVIVHSTVTDSVGQFRFDFLKRDQTYCLCVGMWATPIMRILYCHSRSAQIRRSLYGAGWGTSNIEGVPVHPFCTESPFIFCRPLTKKGTNQSCVPFVGTVCGIPMGPVFWPRTASSVCLVHVWFCAIYILHCSPYEEDRIRCRNDDTTPRRTACLLLFVIVCHVSSQILVFGGQPRGLDTHDTTIQGTDQKGFDKYGRPTPWTHMGCTHMLPPESTISGSLKRRQLFFMTLVAATDVTVRLSRNKGLIVKSTVTDGAGFFTFAHLAPSVTYTLQFGMCLCMCGWNAMCCVTHRWWWWWCTRDRVVPCPWWIPWNSQQEEEEEDKGIVCLGMKFIWHCWLPLTMHTERWPNERMCFVGGDPHIYKVYHCTGNACPACEWSTSTLHQPRIHMKV